MATTPLARLLIVDDEDAIMTALCRTLHDHEYATTGLTSATEALSALRKQEFDLLLTDLMMPEMDGIALLRGALEIDRNLVGIVMTGQGTIDTAVEAMKAGALDYILKPFKLSAILPVLTRALTVRRLRVANTALEQRVRERTAALEEANQELEAFSYSVSHDLRAPLRAIDGFSNIVLRRFAPQMPPEAQRLLNTVSASARQMGQLIDDLLRLSRLGRQPLDKQLVNTSALVHEILDDLRREQGDRVVEVRVGKLADCVGDPSLLKQVFVNLLSNAFKFTRRKEAAIVEVGCRQQVGQTEYWVRDNGAGFDMQYADKLFGAFQRLHTSEQFDGTGIGLSIARRIIQRHGGRIWAEAEVDRGAIFHVSLPG